MLVNLLQPQGSPLTLDWALQMIRQVTRRVEFGPDRLLVRSHTLTELRDAKFRILTAMPPEKRRRESERESE